MLVNVVHEHNVEVFLELRKKGKKLFLKTYLAHPLFFLYPVGKKENKGNKRTSAQTIQ